jgi:hypothetical protein
MHVLSECLAAVLPAITLLSGLLSLYIDPQKEPRKKWVLVFVLVLSAVATAGMSIHDDLAHKSESDSLNDALSTEKMALAKIQVTSGQTLASVSEMGGIITYLGDRFGYVAEQLRSNPSSSTVVQELQVSIHADQKRSSLVSSGSLVSGTKPRVIYYAKDVDTKVVTKALMEEQLDVEIRQPLDQNATNVIWIGDKITPEVAQFVALTLVRAGVKLNKILRFHDGSGKKQNLVEVGAYEEYRSSPILTVDDIAKMTEFPRDPHAGSTPL